MAAVHRIEPVAADLGSSDHDALDAAFDQLISKLDDMSFGQAQRYCQRWQGRLDALVVRRLAAKVSDTGDTRAAMRAASRGGRRSKAAARRQAERAAAVSKNPELARRVDSGSLTPEHLDVLARATRRNADAVHDLNLITELGAAPVDQSKTIVDQWLVENTPREAAEERHETQRRNRSLSQWHDQRDDLAAATIKGDDPTLAEFWAAVEDEANRLYEADGGRDVTAGKHQRTRVQRQFDALMNLVLRRDGANRTSASRPAMVINVDVSSVDGAAELVGVGPLADSVALELLERSDIFINLHDIEGRSLWWGRNKRRATIDQFVRLVVRDRGCVLCGAHWRRSEAHHLMPWNAPGKGDNDVENLALLCSSCHHQLHDLNQTLFVDPASGRWVTRPATPNELPPRQRRRSKRAPPRSGQTAGANAQPRPPNLSLH